MGAALCRLHVDDVVVPVRSIKAVSSPMVDLTEVEKVAEKVEEVIEKIEEVEKVVEKVAEKVAEVEKVEEIEDAKIKSASETLSEFFASLTPVPKESVAIATTMENFIIEVTQDIIKKEEAKHSGPLSPEMIEKLEALSRTVLLKVLPLPPSP